MRADAAQRPGTARQSDAAENVVAQQIGDKCQEGRREQVAQHHPIERQVERVEAEVLVELRVGDTEAAAVQEQLHAHPLALRDEAGQRPDDHRDADADQLQPGHHRGAVARDGIVGSVGRDEHRPGAVGQREGCEHDRAHQQRHHQEQDDAGGQHGREDRAVPQLAEPQPVDVGVDHARPDQQQQYGNQGDHDQNPAPSGQLRHLRRGPHTHSLTPVSGS